MLPTFAVVIILGVRGLISNIDLDTVTENGFYRVNTDHGDVTNLPNVAMGGTLVVQKSLNVNGNTRVINQIYTTQDGRIFERNYWYGTWTTWKRNYDETILTDSATLSSLASALKSYL